MDNGIIEKEQIWWDQIWIEKKAHEESEGRKKKTNQNQTKQLFLEKKKNNKQKYKEDI